MIALERLARRWRRSGSAVVSVRPAVTAKADEFVFQISKDEYLICSFEDLALPNLKKTSIASLMSGKTLTAPVSPPQRRTGQYQRGTFATKLLARRTAMTAGNAANARAGNGTGDHQPANQRNCLKRSGVWLPGDCRTAAKIGAVPFIDTFDFTL